MKTMKLRVIDRDECRAQGTLKWINNVFPMDLFRSSRWVMRVERMLMQEELRSPVPGPEELSLVWVTFEDGATMIADAEVLYLKHPELVPDPQREEDDHTDPAKVEEQFRRVVTERVQQAAQQQGMTEELANMIERLGIDPEKVVVARDLGVEVD